jgi:2-methylaconitate cis-trans-isomerase PrpF
MAVVSIKNKLRRGNLLAGNDPYIPTDFESIATVSVGSGGAANVEFTSIPGTYTHLQIRGIAKTTTSATKDFEVLYMRFNGDTGSNYAFHVLVGSGTSATAGNGVNQSLMFGPYASKSGLADAFAGTVMDILDYANTNKYKTARILTGIDMNGVGEFAFQSGLWRNTNAITSITIYPNANNIAQYSTFALYGIKGA